MVKVIAAPKALDPSLLRRLGPLAITIVALLLHARVTGAHESMRPEPLHVELGAWPGKPSSHDVLVPVVLVVGADGAVEHAEVEVSLSSAFDRAALVAARRWRFKPASIDGVPVAAKVRVAIRFVGLPSPDAVRSGQPPASEAAVSVPAATEASGGQHLAGVEAPLEVLVTGEPAPRSAGEARLTRDILEAAPGRTGSDLLRRAPGMFVAQHSGDGKAHQVFFRGFDAVHGQDLEVSVAGVPVNEVSNVHGQGYADLHFVIPELVERIDVLPGALRPEQGDFAVAGSVRYHLGLEDPGATLKAGLGSHGARRLFMAYRPEHAQAQTFAAVDLYESDGFGTARAAERVSAMGQIQHGVSEGFELRVMASTYAGRFDSAGVLRQRDIDRGLVDRFASYDPRQGGSSGRTQLALELTHTVDGWRSSFMPYLVRRQLRLRFNYTGELETGVDDSTLQFNDADTVGFKALTGKALKLVSSKDSLELGVLTRHDLVQQGQRRLGIGEQLVDAEVRATDVAVFGELGLHPWNRTALFLGMRADGLSYTVDDRLAAVTRSAQGTHLGPKAGLEVGLAPGLRVLAGYGAGFRSPQARSLSDGEPTPFTRVHSFDAGFSYDEGSRFTGSLGGFASLLSDDLVFNEATSRNEPVPATARVGGMLSFEARAGQWFLSACGASYTRATFREASERYQLGDAVPFVPQYVGRCDLHFERAIGRVARRPLILSAGLATNMLLNRPLPYGELGGDLFLLDASLGLAHDGIELALDVENLLDTKWYDGEFVYASRFTEDSSAVPQRHVSVGAPRTVMGTLTLRL